MSSVSQRLRDADAADGRVDHLDDLTRAEAARLAVPLARVRAGLPITQSHLAMLLGRNTRSIKRAIVRGEIPEPRRLNRRVVIWSSEQVLAILGLGGEAGEDGAAE